MRASRFSGLVCCALAVQTWSGGLAAEPPGDAAPEALRTLVQLQFVGQLEEQAQVQLLRLIAGELEAASLGVALVSADDARDPSWLRSSSSARVLMRVRIDVTEASAWRVEIGDVRRSRTLVRSLPGSARNAAAIEAVANVVTAAALALNEGFELKQGDEPPPAARPSSTARVPVSPPPVSRPGLRVVSNVGAEVATFADSVPLQLGAWASLGLRLRERWGLRLHAAQFLPNPVRTEFGEFRLLRRDFGLSLGRSVVLRRLELELELGAKLELIHRTASTAGAGVAFTDDSQQLRLGGVGGVRGRYRVADFLALELGIGGGYFPSPLRYVAEAPKSWILLEAWRGVAQATLGAELSAP